MALVMTLPVIALTTLDRSVVSLADFTCRHP